MVGGLKYTDEAAQLLKNSGNAAEAVKNTAKQLDTAQVLKNKAQGDAFEKLVKEEISKTQSNVVEQITIKTDTGVKTRLDIVGSSKETGEIKLTEAKSSDAAPLTKNQTKAFPEIEANGATIVGKGKEPFVGGTRIPPTKIDIIRPDIE